MTFRTFKQPVKELIAKIRKLFDIIKLPSPLTSPNPLLSDQNQNMFKGTRTCVIFF